MKEVLILDEPIASQWAGRDAFDAVREIQGEVYRDVGDRRTLKFTLAGKGYFLKLHSGVGWTEVFKNWLSGRRPIVDATNEYHACVHLRGHGVNAPRPTALGVRGRDIAHRVSFVVCEALEHHTSLAVLTERWHDTAPPPSTKRAIIESAAQLARRMHDCGVVHRDFYLYHLLVDDERLAAGAVDLWLIDLHRARIVNAVSNYWRVRDLGALMFWCLDRPMTRRDYLRFLRAYENKPLREALAIRPQLWGAVVRRARALYRKARRKGLVAKRGVPDA